MFPTGSFKKILCPDEDACVRPHCAYYHTPTANRKPLWRRRKIKPWLDDGSAMMTLVRYNLCPSQRCTVRLPPRPTTGPRTAFVPVLEQRDGPAAFSQTIEMQRPSSNDPMYPVQNGYPTRPRSSFGMITQGFPGYYGQPSSVYDPNATLYAGYMPSGNYSPAFPGNSSTNQTKLEPIDPYDRFAQNKDPSSVQSTSAIAETDNISTTLATSVLSNSSVLHTSDNGFLKPVKVEIVEKSPEVEIISEIKREVPSPEPPAKKKKKDPMSLPLPKLPQRQRTPPTSAAPLKGNLSQYLAEVARLDEEIRHIEELRVLQDRKKQLLLLAAEEEAAGRTASGITDKDLFDTPIPMPAEDDDVVEEYNPTTSKVVLVKQEIPLGEGPRKLKKRPADETCGYTPTPLLELKRQKEQAEKKKKKREEERKREMEEEERKKKEKEARKRQKEMEEEEIKQREKEALKKRKEKDEREREELRERKRKEKERERKLEAKQKAEQQRLKDLLDKKNKDRHKLFDNDMADLFDTDPLPRRVDDFPNKISERKSDKSTINPVIARRLAEKKMAGVQRSAKLTEEQLLAAKRMARPMAKVTPRVVPPSKPKSAQAQLAERMEKIEKEKQEAAEKIKERVTGMTRRLTEEEKYGGLGNSRVATLSKGETRSSHSRQAPSTSIGKPKLLDPSDFKIPISVRTNFLDKFFEAYLKIYDRVEAAQSAALEEKAVKDRSSTKNAYQVAAIHTVKRIRQSGLTSKTATVKSTVSHMAVMAGRHVGDISVGVNRTKKANMTNMNEKEFYEILKEKYLMSEESLLSNGYPLWVNDDKQEVVMKENEMDKGQNKKRFADDRDLNRICSRCGAEFKLHPKGEVVKADCFYHFGRQWKKKVNGSWETRYNCCDTDMTAPGCCVAKSHVSETLRKSDLKMFRELPTAMSLKDPRSRKVYALDCEMVYTVWGPALARVSVVDIEDDLALDVLVKPPGAIVDANTRFSGLSIDQLSSVTNTIDDAFNRLSELMNRDTIIIGHSLESDLKAMHIVHHNVVDTSVVFPHRLGPPYKKALRTLAGDILQKIIQEDVEGHDSKEDSSACMQLMLHKVKSTNSSK